MKHRIETPENVAVEFDLAEAGSRMLAYVIDLFFLSILIGAILSLFWTKLFYSWFFHGDDLMLAILFGALIILYPLSGYFILFETIMKGQTPGKAILGLRVIRDDGRPAGFRQFLIRNFFRLVDCMAPSMYSFGALSLTFSRVVQRPGDMAAGTLVIRENKYKSAKNFAWKKPSKLEELEGMPALSRESFDLLIRYFSEGVRTPLHARARIASRLASVLIRNARLQDHPEFAAHAFVLEKEKVNLEAATAILSKLMRYYITNKDVQ